jgi:sugar-specific transcriptional regulator TrmB
MRFMDLFNSRIMEENDEGQGGGGANASDDSSGAKDKVAYETYQRILNEKKAEQQKRQELESKFGELEKKLSDIEAEKLKASGDKDALIKSLEDRVKASESKLTTESTKFKLAKVVSTFREVATKEGCQNVDDLQKLYADSFKSVKVDPLNFDVDPESVKEIVSVAKAKSSYLFKAQAPKIDDVNLGGNGNLESYREEIRKCKTQKELDAVRKKYGRA